MRAKRENGGPGGLKIFTTTPFRSLENAPFLDNLPLKEATDHNRWWSYQKILKLLSWRTSKDTAFFILVASSSMYEFQSLFPTTLAVTAFFTYKINKRQQIIGSSCVVPGLLVHFFFSYMHMQRSSDKMLFRCRIAWSKIDSFCKFTLAKHMTSTLNPLIDDSEIITQAYWRI